MNKKEIEQQVTEFFHDLAMRQLETAHADPNDASAVKQMMLNHCEMIYPAFSLTAVFRENNGKNHHEDMVEAYRLCYTMLLQGRLP